MKQFFSSVTAATKLTGLLAKGNSKVKVLLPANSYAAWFWYDFYKKSGRTLWVIASNRTQAGFLYDDLLNFGSQAEILFLPASFKFLNNPGRFDIFDLNRRLFVLNKIFKSPTPLLIVTYAESFLEKIPPSTFFKQERQDLKQSDRLDPGFLNELLFDLNYERTDVVTEPGEFAWSGRVVDIFPFGSDRAYRLEFEFDILESIRLLDTETQLSHREVASMEILPNPLAGFSLIPLREIVSPNQAVFSHSFTMLRDLSRSVTKEKNLTDRIDTDFSAEGFKPGVVLLSGQFQPVPGLNPQVDDLPVFAKKIDRFLQFLKESVAEQYQVMITSGNPDQLKRIQDIVEAHYPDLSVEYVRKNFYKGFVAREDHKILIPEHQIFDRPAKKRQDELKVKKQKQLLREIDQWQKGDYIVHTDYGIGIYEGLVKIEKGGKPVEVVKLRYKDGDALYVSIHSLFKLSKYRGKDGKKPKIHKMGSAVWEKTKQKTKKRIKRLAFDLIRLYAERKSREGFAFAPDSPIQWELEASFVYEDTPDQKKATEEVKRDMESPQPMDRLVCGDVGFGKTEVAVRAAFKAVDNGKQVAVLVPTTILAFQHYQTFSERLAEFPVRVEYINRFRTAKQRREILQDLAEGRIDIIIGTHVLAGDAVKFKDLGLLIIDEEQKFGVNVKEKIKHIKKNVDVLTLTATPIPRTLQFSLLGERDLSIINTPPPNRFPVETQVVKFNPDLIKTAIEKELDRGGQVFFVHNRIENIEEIRSFLSQIIPQAKIAVAHGKTEGKQLEKNLLDFRLGKYDVLISTAIVESGLDVPNANTMFVNNAHQFGLADLHQLRGRVGRSNRKAYCYFIIPSYESLTEEARKRIETLETYTSLGDGFEIAMKDLEIRGAGDLLGAEQSGFINELGFETYRKILEEAVEELKNEEFQELFDQPLFERVKDIQIQTDRLWQFPDNYIPSGKERLYYYRKINEINDEKSLEQLKIELRDRFGLLPAEAEELLTAAGLKIVASKLGFEKLVFRNNDLYMYLTGAKPFLESGIWKKILQYVASGACSCQLKQKNEKVYLFFENKGNPFEARKILEQISHAVFDSE